jgi:hypothetical protein
MRRTKAALIYKKTVNRRAVQPLLGHTKLESTVRYFGIEVEDALQISEQIELRVAVRGSSLGDCHRILCRRHGLLLLPGIFKGQLRKRIERSSSEAGDFRRSPSQRRSCTTCTPPLSLSGNSTGNPQCRSPGCLFTRPIAFWILASY